MLINCDLGECLTPNPDKTLMPLIDMANIACGGHIGDDTSMAKTIELAMQNGVKIGAHPSYADTANFGRISQNLSDDALFDLIYQQITDLQTLCTSYDTKIEHIKPHGALYHDMMQNKNVFDVLCRVIEAVDLQLSLVVESGNQYQFDNQSVKLLREAFADRAYKNMKMIPRSQKGAVLNNANAIVEQYQYFSNTNSMNIDTICFHSDNPASIKALKLIKP